jgi:steroid 5-alpha reductase family enzyme
MMPVGEIMLWSGLWLSCSQSLPRFQKLLSAFSPAFVALLLTKVSGIPLLEHASKKKWGHLAAYKRHVANTAVLIPFIW